MRLKLILGIWTALTFGVGFVAFADDTPVLVSSTSAAVVNPCADPAFAAEKPELCHVAGEPSAEELFQEGQAVYTAWKTVGTIAGLLALVNLLMNLTKIGMVGAYIKKKDLKWVRPVLACALGGLAGAATAKASGMATPMVIVQGLIAGLGSVGFHELVEAMKS